MSGGRIGVLVGVLSAVGVLLVVMAVADRKSPGRVATVHGRIAELDGGEACRKCHGGWFGDMTAACNECHQPIAQQLADGRGLHGRLDAGLGRACSTCHGEHHGDEFRLVNRLAFAQAGVDDPRQFDHRLIGYTMAGRHLELQCVECHEHADAELLPEGSQRFLGLVQDCASCHDDPHQGRMQHACVDCHGQTDFHEHEVRDHDRWLPLTGAHGRAGCRACHAEETPHALEWLAPGRAAGSRQCADCHASPHADAFVAGNAALAELSPTAACAVCHDADREPFAAPVPAIAPPLHSFGGFALEAPHDHASCADCHRGETFAERHPGRRADDCASCHADPHEGQFAATACVDCHARTRFAPHEIDAARHAEIAMPLHGRHAELACSACHVDPPAERARRFRGTPTRCEQCHVDAHLGVFAARAGERLAAAPQGTCAVCHTPDGFRTLDHAAFDHAGWTGFAIDGAHAQIECDDCHPRSTSPDEYHRTFGRIATVADDPAGCERCHGDPHGGRFDAAPAPADVDGRVGCVRCHDAASFRALPHGFDHAVFTGFALQGRHGELPCGACHAPAAAPAGEGARWPRAAGRDCQDCHRDPHREQFARDGVSDCARCHKNARSFATLAFRHNLDSRFPIEEQHRKVACASCHPQETEAGVTFVRYKPLPTECVDCHGHEEGGAAARRRRR